MILKQYPLVFMGDEIVGEDDDTEYFIIEYEFDKKHMIYHKAEVFYPESIDTGYFHNLN